MLPRLCVLCGLLGAVAVLGALAKDDVAFYHSLSEAELRDLPSEDSEYDDEEAGAFGGQLHSFFRESNSQLILDLDLFTHFWHELDNVRVAAGEGNADYIRDIIAFFEPLRDYDVSASCTADIFHFLWTTYNYAREADAARACDNCNCSRAYKEAVASYQWIFDVVDAVGKVPAAITGGNNLWLGSWSTCRKISTVKNVQNQTWNGQYCMTRYYAYNRYNPLKAFTEKPDPTKVCRSNRSTSYEDWLPEEKSCFAIMPLLNVGLCMPDTCTDYDVKRVVEFLYTAAEMSMDKKFVCNLVVECSNDRVENRMYNNVPSMIVLCLVLAVLSIVFYGTCYDYYVAVPAERDGLRQPNSTFIRLLLMFSVRRNAAQLMDTTVTYDKEDPTKPDMIRCLHGARFLSMCWIIFGHTYYYICSSFTTDNLIVTLRNFPKLFYNQIVVQAPLAVDSFFFLSGLLTTYIFIKKLNNGSAKLGEAKTWVAYYIRRYLRLTPIYLAVMMLNVTLFEYISDGPFWRPIERNRCRNSWWVNLLYLNNFLKQDDPCMGWTWYMANDFQLHCFAPILIIALYKFHGWGVLLGILMIAASCATNLYITLTSGYPPAPILSTSLDLIYLLDSYWVELYVKPYIRCVPYIIGSIVGYLLNRTKRKFVMRPVTLYLAWLGATLVALYSVFGLFHYTKTGELSVAWHVGYTLFGRLAFSLFLGWLTFACETGNADKINRIIGHKMFIPLSRMTFCAYLIHPILLQLYYLSRNTAFHFTHSFQMFYMFSVAVFSSYLCSLVFCLTVELPVTNFDKLVFTPRHQASPSNGATANREVSDGKSGIEMDSFVPSLKTDGASAAEVQQPLLPPETQNKD